MLSKKDIFTVLGATAVLGFCGWQLYQDFYYMVYSNPADSVGEISYRYRIAQRRSSQSVVWENVDQGSKVYNYNFVRTDAHSEAIIILKDKTKIELDPDSMIVLEVKPGKAIVKFERGSILVRRFNSGSSETLTVQTGDRKVLLTRGDARLIRGKEKRLEVAALKGGVVLKDAKGEQEVKPGRRALMEGGRKRFIGSGDILLAPADNFRRFSDSGRESVKFSWEPRKGALFQLARTRTFNKIHMQRKADSGVQLDLKEGIYYWRVLFKENGQPQHSIARKLRIINKPPLVLKAPLSGEVFHKKNTAPLVSFVWGKNS